ncbi:MAG: hypothetical protein WCG85_05345 [Polyangia bacterium]
MGKPTRSPLLGYNHNVRYGGRILHVQTEDSGPSNPHLFTHLFFEGSILATKRFQYDAATNEDGVRGLMQGQHKEILKELKQGLFDDRLEDFFAARGEAFTAPRQARAEASGPVLFATATAAPSTHADALPPRAARAEATPSPGPEILDLDSIPTPPPDRMQTPEPLPVHAIRPTLPGRGAYTFKRPTRDIATADPNETDPGGRRATKPPSSPASPVVVQRRIVVGAGEKKPGLGTRPVAPRPRRPGGGIPYVVQEGSHPNLIVRRQPEAGVPPAAPMDERADAAAAPRTAAPPPIPQEPPAESLVSTRSLDDVILAYLSKSDQKR